MLKINKYNSFVAIIMEKNYSFVANIIMEKVLSDLPCCVRFEEILVVIGDQVEF